MKDRRFLPAEQKADWDVGIAVDAIKLADKLDVIVLVTGDGDYLPLVSYLQNTKGCLVEVIAFRQTASSKPIEEADDFLNLSENKNICSDNFSFLTFKQWQHYLKVRRF